jgi:hypothetical protein
MDYRRRDYQTSEYRRQRRMSVEKFYMMDLAGMIASVDELDWGSLHVEKMRMQKFFMNREDGGDTQPWHQKLKAFDIASSGVKGGALFLLRQDKFGKIYNAYAIKFTDTPYRSLFGEYVCRNVAQIKTPKTIVVQLDWNDQTAMQTDGMIMVNFVTKKSNALWVKQWGKGAGEKNEKWEAFCQTLNQKKPRYMIIMKMFRGKQLNVDVAADLREFLEAKFAKDKTLTERENAVQKTTAQDIRKQKLNTDTKYKNVVEAILVNKEILSRPQWLRQLGKSVISSILCNYGDHFIMMNWKNIFFIDKQYNRTTEIPRYKKVDNPVAFIDNDCLLTVYDFKGGKLHPEVKVHGRTGTDPEIYIRYLLNQPIEIGASNPIQATPGATTKDIILDFDTWFAGIFYSKVMGLNASYDEAPIPLLAELYKDDGDLFGKQPGAVMSLGADIKSKEWQDIKAEIKIGMAEGIAAVQGFSDTDIDDFDSIYAYLVNYYKCYNDVNFDIRAFSVMRQFLMQIDDVDAGKGTWAAIDLDVGFDQIVTHLQATCFQTQNPLEATVDEALQFGESSGLLSSQVRQTIASQLVLLTVSRQRALLPQAHIKKIVDPNQHKVKFMLVGCAMLKMFADFMSKYYTGAHQSEVVVYAYNHIAGETGHVIRGIKVRFWEVNLESKDYLATIIERCGFDEKVFRRLYDKA